MDSELSRLNHRSKKRIQDLGEVFTPESYVEEMLDLLEAENKKIWSDEDIAFFEPCCGHGNIVLPIYRRRMEAIYKKSLTHGFTKTKEASFYAVANALNTLWAIDIDSKNIENTRTRVFQATLEFLKLKLNASNTTSLVSKNKEFFAHILSAIRWQINENETLSALSKEKEARAKAGLTKFGTKWFNKNGHNELDFELTWVNYFESCEQARTIPMEFERASRFLDGITSGKSKGFEEFNFAKIVLESKTEEQFSLGA